MVIKMLLNSDILKKFLKFTLSKGNKCNYAHYFFKFKNNFESFHLDKILIKYEFSNFMFL